MPDGLSLSDFKAVLFDVDGTLVDTLPALVRSLGDTYKRFNGLRPSDAELRGIIGLPLTKQMRLFTDKPISDEDLERRIDFAVQSFESYAYLEQEFEPTVQALRLIADNGLKTALVTSKSAVEVSHLEKRLPWIRNVDTMICATDVTHPKPDPESALLACRRLKVEPRYALFVGDSVFDMQCARRAGTKRVAVGYGSGNKEALLEQNPELFFETPDEFLAWAKESIFRTPCLEGRT